MIVLNTCTIREKPDTRFAAHMGNAAKLKRDRPGTVVAVGGCYAEAQRERLFALYPDVDVAFGPGTISHLGDWLGAGGEGVERGSFGTGEERAFAARLPVHRERRFQAWVQVSMGCNSVCSYCIVPAVRGRRDVPPPRRDPRRDRAPRRRRCPRGDSARPERQLVRARRGLELRGAPACGRRRPRDRAHPLHEPAPEGLPPRRHRRDGRVRCCVRARAPAAAVGLEPDPEGDAADVLAGAVPAARRRAAWRDPGPRAHDRHHRRLPGRDRRRLPRDARGGGGGRVRRRLHVRLLAAGGHRGGGDDRPGARRGEARAHRAAGRASCNGLRPSGTRAGSGWWRKSSSKAPAGPSPSSCAAGRAATRP